MTRSSKPLPAAPVFEVELKLSLPSTQFDRLKRHPALKTISPHRAVIAELDAVYFDTPELALQAQGIAVRLRQAAGNWVQTVKTRGEATGGLHQRPEWEFPSNGRDLCFEQISDLRVRAVLESPTVRPRLIPVFRTRFRRWARLLVLPDGGRIELALDQGEILVGEASEAISEVELELKAGHADALFQLALALLPQLALFPEQRSKAERGYRLYANAPVEPRRMALPSLKPGFTVRQACAVFLAGALTALQNNLGGARLGVDPEFLHQVRVALRRLRTTLSLFKAALAHEELTEIKASLRNLMRELGPAREWDVMLNDTLPAVALGRADAKALAWLKSAAQQQRDRAQTRARCALGAPETARLLILLGAMVSRLHAGPSDARTDAGSEEPRLASFARQALRRRGRRGVLNAEQMAALDTNGRHEWRIALKKLRYASDFLAPLLLGRRDSRRWIAALSSLQDILGLLNDAETSFALLAPLQAAAAGSDPPGTANCGNMEAVAWVRGYAEGLAQAGLKQLEPLRKSLRQRPAPWKQ